MSVKFPDLPFLSPSFCCPVGGCQSLCWGAVSPGENVYRHLLLGLVSVCVCVCVSVCVCFQGCSVEERDLQEGRSASWTGTGFARVPEGSSLEFTISNIPYSLEIRRA